MTLKYVFGGFVGLALASMASAQDVLPTAKPDVYLGRGFGIGDVGTGVAYHEVFNQYYSTIGGKSAWVYDSLGYRIQDTMVDVDTRGMYYDSASKTVRAFNRAAFTTGGLFEIELDAAGLIVGSSSVVLSPIPGIAGLQSMPVADPARGVFYSRDSDHRVLVADGQTGELLFEVELDFATAGLMRASDFSLGFDPALDVFVVVEQFGFRAVVFDTNGNYVGDSRLSVTGPQHYGVQYANGLLFVLIPSNFGWQGYEVVVQCYADCDRSGELDIFDFLCFQNQFIIEDPLADCDDSGGWDIFDFLCYQDKFAAGCS